MEVRVTKSNLSSYPNSFPEFEKRAYKKDEKANIIRYMSSFAPFCVAGLIFDCITGKFTKDEAIGYTDGYYVWSSTDIYHIKKYDAAVTDDFLRHVMSL